MLTVRLGRSFRGVVAVETEEIIVPVVGPASDGTLSEVIRIVVEQVVGEIVPLIVTP